MRIIDASKLDVIAYDYPSINKGGYANTFDDGVRWLAEQIDAEPTISVEDVIAEYFKDHNINRIVIGGVEYAPVVRCGKCKYWDPKALYCPEIDEYISNDKWFCGSGDQKENDDNESRCGSTV